MAATVQLDSAELDSSVAYREALDRELNRFFREQCARARDYDESYVRLWDALRAVSHGGKRIRSRLVHETYAALGGRNVGHATAVGLAFELLHTAFVIHDDIIDGDVLRRGQLNVTGQFLSHAQRDGLDYATARHWAESSALIGGDLMLTHAQRYLAVASIPEPVRRQLLDLFEYALYVTAAGEQADVSYSVRSPEELTLDNVITMATHKTAVYSFGAPLRAGVLLAGGSADLAALVGDFGLMLGTAYQLRDDFLGLYGDSAVTGKSVLSDLRGGKNTPLMIFARGTDAWPLVEEMRHREDVDSSELAAVRTALDECGARAFLERLEAEHVERADLLTLGEDMPAALGELLRSTMRSLAARAA
ncbi:polyprenyl synthetase family protein [Klugiella xanthotipulae]|uniref:Geranylgeranyl diphosphate synthase type II n=1 Tax=Klugiella xanthotipulae TaxID=244735 RepID=A0A543HYR3_9MICO|nr:polyprenyl synthetase family protein [Klugiella xanthotipulae]TQM63483.1 geranylgeranyl diphosphate synthase type II [Klugiella xanthotipulae]